LKLGNKLFQSPPKKSAKQLRNERKSVSSEKAKQGENERASESIFTSAKETWKEYDNFSDDELSDGLDGSVSIPDKSGGPSKRLSSDASSTGASSAGTSPQTSSFPFSPGQIAFGELQFMNTSPGSVLGHSPLGHYSSAPGTSTSFSGSEPPLFTGYEAGSSAPFAVSGPPSFTGPGAFDHFYRSTYHQTPMVIISPVAIYFSVVMR
jgi:hypothetical protein